jgi:hypothetical protein
MTNVTVYHRTVPNAKNQEKIDLLKYFSQGAKVCGDTVIDCNEYYYTLSDVAVIQGWSHGEPTEIMRPHLALRRRIIHQQRKHQRHVVVVDSNLFLYANTENPLHYLRYSFDGIFPKTGIYCDSHPDAQRWQQISRDLGISLKPWRTAGNHVLLLLQRNGGWSMGNYNVVEWANDTVRKIRQHTDRPIVVRTHPGDKAACDYITSFNQSGEFKNVTISNNKNLLSDLKNCWAAVNHNSSPVVGAAIEGVPIFVTDPVHSQSAEVANHDLVKIETPDMPDRQLWVERLSMSHWKFEELQNGSCWSHMKKFI